MPSHDGSGLVNLIAEIEHLLGGHPPLPRLSKPLVIPAADTYVLCLFDGLGASALSHPAASSLRASSVGVLDAPFPSTTTVSLATVATGLAPAGHGVIGHLMWIPQLDQVVNILKWRGRSGVEVRHDTTEFLPSPNLWERLGAIGVEPITVQPADFIGTPLTKMLYRGCRFEPASTAHDTLSAVIQLAAVPKRFILAYFPQVDYAAHLWGTRSPEYAAALSVVDSVWSSLSVRLPENAALLGTSDHGHIDYGETDKVLIRDQSRLLQAYGDPRTVYLRGQPAQIEGFIRESGGTRIDRADLLALWGDRHGIHPDLSDRIPDAAVMAPSGRVILPPGFDRRLIGYHGGLDPAELEIPLLRRQSG